MKEEQGSVTESDEIEKPKPSKVEDKQKKKKRKKNAAVFWTIQVFVMTLMLSFSFSLVSELVISAAHVVIAIVVLLILIVLSIIFDIIAVAFTSCDIAPFHSMASRKIKGARKSMRMLKNADKVSSICGDIIGDICGIVSGSAGAAIALILAVGQGNTYILLAGIIISSIIASLTVGGKSIGKNFAMKHSQKIVLFVGKLLSIFGEK